jgi:hypothetical protein
LRRSAGQTITASTSAVPSMKARLIPRLMLR